MNKKGLYVILIGLIIVIIGAVYLLEKDDKQNSPNIIIYSNPTQEAVQTSENTAATTISNKNTTVSKNTTVTTDSAIQNTETEPSKQLYININSASAEELEQLDGIGNTLALRIVEYRNANIQFNNIEELMNVDGIGEKKFEAIRDYVYVENPIYTDETLTEEQPVQPIEEVIEVETQQEAEQSEELTEAEPVEATINPTDEPALTLDDIAPLDLNTASREEVLLLPYFNDEIADDFFMLRDGIGKFQNVYELCYLEKLTNKQVSEIMKYVTVVK